MSEINDTIPFHKMRVITTSKEVKNEDGTKTTEPLIMGFVSLKEPSARLKDKQSFVTFDEDVIDELQGAGKGDLIEFEADPPSDKGQDPVITDAQIVSE